LADGEAQEIGHVRIVRDEERPRNTQTGERASPAAGGQYNGRPEPAAQFELRQSDRKLRLVDIDPTTGNELWCRRAGRRNWGSRSSAWSLASLPVDGICSREGGV